MLRLKLPALFALGVFFWGGPDRTASAQTGRGADPAGRVLEGTAEELGKQFAPDTPEPLRKYQGRVLRVSGRVSMAHEPFIYLGTGSKFPTGQPVMVTLDYSTGKMPEVNIGALVVVEGRLERAGIFGPILTECRLVPREADGKGRPAANAAGADRPPTPDPRAIALRFDGPVREGDKGYRPQCTSFRLRFGPGAWRGTVVGRSTAWGNGNEGKDHWGVGSGEEIHNSPVFEDHDGAYFVFSLNGTDWESDRVAVLFRLTLPDGKPGVATALVPVDPGL